jgi:spoIIIJ-associated protein
MAIEIEFEGETLEEALHKASLFFNSDPSLLDYQVIEKGGKGFFGRIGRVKIMARKKDPLTGGLRPAKEVARQETAPAADKRRVEGEREEKRRTGSSSQREEIVGFLKELFAIIGFRLDPEVRGGSMAFSVNLRGKDRKFLLINGGEPLSALQFIVNKVFGMKKGWKHRITLDSEGFRHRRDDRTREMALEAAEAVKASGEAKLLPPMNPYERRLVHLTIKELPGVVSESQGDGFIKQVLIKPGEEEGEGFPEG